MLLGNCLCRVSVQVQQHVYWLMTNQATTSKVVHLITGAAAQDKCDVNQML